MSRMPGWPAVLALYPARARPIAPPEPLGNAGGLSGARLWRFASGVGPLVARAWPVDGPDLASLGRVHGWLAEAGDLGFLPVPIPTLDGRTAVPDDGRIWEVAPWMPGAADPGRPPPRLRLRAAFAGLAAFHARLGRHRFEGTSPGLAARLGDVRGLILDEFAAIRSALALARDRADPRAGLAARWLDRAEPLAPALLGVLGAASARVLPLQPCLRDARPDHFLFDGDRLTGLVDFGAMGRETVAADLARLLAESVGPDRPSRLEALAAYEAVRPLAPPEAATIPTFERANALLGAGRWARWHFLDRRTFDDPDAVRLGLLRGLERLEEGNL